MDFKKVLKYFSHSVGNRAFKYSCPAGLHFSEKSKSCDYANKVRCSINVVAAQETEGDFEAFDDSEEEEEHVHTIIDDPDYMIDDPRCLVDESDKFHPIEFAHPTDWYERKP